MVEALITAMSQHPFLYDTALKEQTPTGKQTLPGLHLHCRQKLVV